MGKVVKPSGIPRNWVIVKAFRFALTDTSNNRISNFLNKEISWPDNLRLYTLLYRSDGIKIPNQGEELWFGLRHSTPTESILNSRCL